MTTRYDASRTVETILCALRTECPTIAGAAVCHPSGIQTALQRLEDLLFERYAQHFSKDDFGLLIEGEKWRAGLAIPLHPMNLPQVVLPFHKTKNAIIVGATDEAVLVAKREVPPMSIGAVL